jgi:hypothetical protein
MGRLSRNVWLRPKACIGIGGARRKKAESREDGNDMAASDEKMKEKFVIRMTDDGVEVTSGEGQHLFFTACEALMFLDILKMEEENLRRMADEASPLPIRIEFAPPPSSPAADEG